MMWNFFKATTLSVAGERLGVRRVTRKGFVSEGTLRLIDKSREARLSGDPEAREPAGRTHPVGRPHDTWLRQMDRHFAGAGIGRVAAWRMAIRRPKEYRSKVDAATRCRGACSH